MNNAINKVIKIAAPNFRTMFEVTPIQKLFYSCLIKDVLFIVYKHPNFWTQI